MNGTISIRDRVHSDQLATRKILVAIVAFSVVARVLAALYMGNTVEWLPGIADQESYHELALRVLGGHGFSFGETWWPITAADAPTAHWSFLYTLYLTVVYAIFGPNPLAARLLQAVAVGILQPVLLYLIGRTVFNRLVGLVAALLGAVYIYLIYYSAALMTEAFYITAILACFYLLFRLAQSQDSHPWRLAVMLGVAIGMAVLSRQLFLLIVPLLFLWVWWVRYRGGAKLPFWQTVVVGGIVVLMILPFTIYNANRFGRFVLLNTNSGYAFFWGNHPIYGTQFVPILTTTGTSYQELIPNELLGLDEAALESELMQRGIQFVVDDPGRIALLSLSRIPPYFEFWPSADTGLIGNISRVFSFGIMLPFMIAGIIISLRHRKRGSFSTQPVFALLLFAVVYTIIHLLTWTLIRYRLPIDAVLLPFAALALVALWFRLTDTQIDPVTGDTI